jgi:hypothetical protein
MLASPKLVPRGRDPAGIAAGSAYALNDLEWRRGFRSSSEQYPGRRIAREQARRLRDPNTGTANTAHGRGSEITGAGDEFRGQFQLRNIRNATPDKNDFPNFDHTLRQAFARAGVVRRGASFARGAGSELLTATTRL